MSAKTRHPCVGRCSTSFGGDICRGCGRTVEEIRDWNRYTEEKKREVLKDLPDRIKAS